MRKSDIWTVLGLLGLVLAIISWIAGEDWTQSAFMFTWGHLFLIRAELMEQRR